MRARLRQRPARPNPLGHPEQAPPGEPPRPGAAAAAGGLLPERVDVHDPVVGDGGVGGHVHVGAVQRGGGTGRAEVDLAVAVAHGRALQPVAAGGG